jgi:hypothetical protein
MSQSEVPLAEDGTDRWAAIRRFLAQLPEADRAGGVHLVLRTLRARTEPDQILACELAWEGPAMRRACSSSAGRWVRRATPSPARWNSVGAHVGQDPVGWFQSLLGSPAIQALRGDPFDPNANPPSFWASAMSVFGAVSSGLLT